MDVSIVSSPIWFSILDCPQSPNIYPNSIPKQKSRHFSFEKSNKQTGRILGFLWQFPKFPKVLKSELQICFQKEGFGSEKLSSGQRFAKTQMYETNKAVISSASSHTDAWHWQVLCMHWDCHRGIPTWSKHWENMKSLQWHKQRRAQNSLFPSTRQRALWFMQMHLAFIV